MANVDEKNCAAHEESSPLLDKKVAADDKKVAPADDGAKKPGQVTAAHGPLLVPIVVGGGGGWTADGLPLAHGSVMGEPMERAQWNSSLFACLGRNDEFCSSDLEVCESLARSLDFLNWGAFFCCDRCVCFAVSVDEFWSSNLLVW